MPPTRPSAARAGRLVPVVFLCLLGAYLLTHCRVSSAVKPMWMDEVLSYTLIIDPSPPHMLDTLAHGADGGFPLYYLIGWTVAHAVSPTEWHLRLISSVLEIAAFALWFGVLRRTYGTLPAMLATTVGVGGSTLLLYQNSELRFYTLLLLAAVVALVAYDRFFRRPQAAGTALLNTAGHAMLVLTHPFGLVYSAMISLSAIVACYRRQPGRVLARYLISSACGDAFFLCWLRSFLAQSRVVADHTMIPVPTVADFFRIYLQVAPLLYYEDRTKAWAARTFLPVSHHLAAVMLTTLAAGLLVAAVAMLARRLLARPPGSANDAPDAPSDMHLQIVAVALILIPAVVWVTSHLGKSLFIHRYFVPSALAFTIFYARAFAFLGCRITQNRVWTTWRRDHPARALGLAVVGAALFAGVYVVWPMAAAWNAPDGFAELQGRIARARSGDIPVVSPNGSEFWEFGQYAPANPFWFVLDREAAFDPRNGLPAASEFVLATAFARSYPALHIARGEDFLARNPRFIVEDAPDNLWFARCVRGNPAYRVADAPDMAPGNVLVTRADAAPATGP